MICSLGAPGLLVCGVGGVLYLFSAGSFGRLHVMALEWLRPGIQEG